MLILKRLLCKYQAFVLYVVFGVLTTLVNIGVYYLCYELVGITNVGSTIISWFAAVSFAFVSNKQLVFGSADWSMSQIVAEGLKYLFARVSTGVIEVVMMYVAVDLLLQNGTFMRLLTCIVVIILNFVLSRFFVFRPSKTSDHSGGAL